MAETLAVVALHNGNGGSKFFHLGLRKNLAQYNIWSFCLLQNAGKFAAKTNVASIASMSDSLNPVCLFSPKLSTPFLKQESKSVPIVIKKCKHGKDLTDGCK